jgi:hypothetical protein
LLLEAVVDVVEDQVLYVVEVLHVTMDLRDVARMVPEPLEEPSLQEVQEVPRGQVHPRVDLQVHSRKVVKGDCGKLHPAVVVVVDIMAAAEAEMMVVAQVPMAEAAEAAVQVSFRPE